MLDFSNTPAFLFFHFALMQNETKNQGCIPSATQNRSFGGAK
jgi:hypothetical protein